MFYHHVSAVARNRHTKHRLLGGPVMFFGIFIYLFIFAFLAAAVGEGETRGVHLDARCH